MKGTLMICRLISLGALSTLSALSACSPGEDHTVSWYQEHAPDRAAKLTWCADDTARQSEIDCKNAAQAMATGGDFSKRFQPSMNWGTSADSKSSSPNPSALPSESSERR